MHNHLILSFMWMAAAFVGAALLSCLYQFFVRGKHFLKVFLLSFVVCASLLAALWHLGGTP